VKYIVLTTIFSVPLDREFGLDTSFVDKPSPRIPELIISQEVALKINLYEPRAKFRDIQLDGDLLAGSLKITITISIDLTQPVNSNIPSPVSTAIVPTPTSPVYIYQQGADGSTIPWVKGPPGPVGPKGSRGSMWWNGIADPITVSDSLPGDYYLNTTSGDVFLLS